MTIAQNAPAIVDEDGIVYRLGELPVISADDAGRLLPRVQEWVRQARRLESYLADTLSAEMQARGQSERLVDSTVFELKPEATWTVDDEHALYDVLESARERGEMTEVEFLQATECRTAYSFHHGRLNLLAKRLPEIERLRRRVEGAAKLRIKK